MSRGDENTTPAAEPEPLNAFEHLLRNHRRGIALNDASAELSEAVKAARDTGKGAELTVKVKLTPAKAGDDQLVVDIQVTSKLPKEKLPASIFWADDDDRLHTSDPNQKEFKFREVATRDESDQPREVAGG